MKILFLDDQVDRHVAFLSKYPGSTCVETSVECVRLIEGQAWDMICLDHDLRGQDTGMHVVDWIVQRLAPAWPTTPPIFAIHSTNMFFAAQMLRRLTEAGYFAIYVPFGNPFKWQTLSVSEAA